MRIFKHYCFKAIVGLWILLPVKLFFVTILKRFPFVKSKLYKDLRYKGNLKIKLYGSAFIMYNPGNTTIENEIFWNGLDGWEKISVQIWIKLCQDSRTILDIGANTGIYSLIACAVNPKSKIYSFEPVNRTANLFKKNLSLNPNFDITLIEKAVSNENGSFDFYDLPHESQYSASLNKEMLSSHTDRIKYKVETIKLDTFDKLTSEKIDLIKLDVEMHEPEALAGMMDLIVKNKPFLLIEILTNDIGSKIQKLFSELDYEYYNIDELHVPEKVEVLTASNHYNYLFVPKNKEFNFAFLKE